MDTMINDRAGAITWFWRLREIDRPQGRIPFRYTSLCGTLDRHVTTPALANVPDSQRTIHTARDRHIPPAHIHESNEWHGGRLGGYDRYAFDGL